MKHKHNWVTISEIDRETHKEGDKYITYFFKQICECGAYQYKEFKHLQDIESKNNEILSEV